MLRLVNRSITVKITEKFLSRGAVAQLGERLVRNEEATGSIPVSSTMFSITSGCPKPQSCPNPSQTFEKRAAEFASTPSSRWYSDLTQYSRMRPRACKREKQASWEMFKTFLPRNVLRSREAAIRP